LAARWKSDCLLCRVFTPHLHPERLEAPLKRRKPAVIFCGSMCDLFDPNVTREWREKIWNVIERATAHSFVILTKCPVLIDMRPLENLWLGVSAEDGTRAEYRFQELKNNWKGKCVLSYEPVLGPFWNMPLWQALWRPWAKFDWLIIGAQTGAGAVRPKRDWVEDIINVAQSSKVPVFVKNNMLKYFPDLGNLRNWPAGMQPVSSRREAG